MPTANVTMTVREVTPRVRIVDIEGEITAFSEEEITRAHEEASRGGVDAVILNFEGLDYMNSGGIGLLVTLVSAAVLRKREPASPVRTRSDPGLTAVYPGRPQV